MTAQGHGTGRAQVAILGPLAVTLDGEPVSAAGPRQRAVLAMLAVHAGEVVAADVLAEAAWGDEAVSRSRGTLHVYLSNLRRVLGDPAAIASHPPGYLLDLRLVEVDAALFEDDVAAGRAAAEAGDHAEAAHLLHRGLDRWRGELLADLVDLPGLDGVLAYRARLAELRLAAFEDCMTAELALGRHDVVIAELEAACRLHPSRERGWALLMLALYRGGRQGDALAAFRRARAYLLDELGIDPGPALRRLEQSILEQSGSLGGELAVVVDGADAVAPALLWLDLDGRMHRRGLDPGRPATIGRGEDRDVRLGWDAKVSRSHAVLECTDGWLLADAGSANGTWLNGVRITASVLLANGDLVRCGDTALFVRLDETSTVPDGGGADITVLAR